MKLWVVAGLCCRKSVKFRVNRKFSDRSRCSESHLERSALQRHNQTLLDPWNWYRTDRRWFFFVILCVFVIGESLGAVAFCLFSAAAVWFEIRDEVSVWSLCYQKTFNVTHWSWVCSCCRLITAVFVQEFYRGNRITTVSKIRHKKHTHATVWGQQWTFDLSRFVT